MMVRSSLCFKKENKIKNRVKKKNICHTMLLTRLDVALTKMKPILKIYQKYIKNKLKTDR